ncbi:MAG: hypothetical protein LAT65_00060 [Saccharospirillum sp.]|nr:hypothetical protein [Saccharospirillum sp.]
MVHKSTRSVLPNGRTLLFPIIGDPIAQVHSPAYLTPLLTQRDINALVVPLHVKPAHLKLVIDSLFHSHNVPGLILTMPHKHTAFTLCDELSDRASLVNAVNVMRKTADGLYFGDHMDGIGYLNSLERLGYVVPNCRALVIGAGGAGSAIAYELLVRGAAHVDVYDTKTLLSQQLINRLMRRFGARVGMGSCDPTGYTLVANASPAGMNAEDPEPVNFDKLRSDQFVAEAITEPAATPLLNHANAIGCKTMTGADMFAGQSEALVEFLCLAHHPDLKRSTL